MNKKTLRIIGIIIMVLSLLLWALLLAVPWLDYSKSQKAVITTVIIVLAEVFFYISIVILGKEIFNKYKNKILFWKKGTMKQVQVIMPKLNKIRFSIQGSGKPVVLLHGYLESIDIWDGFSDELAKQYQVICIDLPGHGQTIAPHGDASTEYMAECVKQVLDHLKIHKAVVIGHSMGGYAMLAFAEKYNATLAGIGLFHSITWADLPEKREARDREIELIKESKKQLIYNVNIPKGFADSNLETFKCEVDRAKRIAAATPDDGIIAALNALKNRPDRTAILETIDVPVFFGIGLKDNYIPVEKLMALTVIPSKKQITIFENSGHMGFIEEKAFAVDEMDTFLKTCYLKP